MTSAATDPHGADPHSEAASARVAELFERHGRMVYGICRAMLRDAQEAEDATQQAFLSAHRALLTGTCVRDPGAWMATIARNECRRRIAVGMRTPLPIADDDLAEVPHRVDEAERLLQAGALRSALDELPERQREAVFLRYVYGLRYGEVAKALGLSRPATEALLFRARRTMRVRLRHVAGAAALVVPFSVREEIALALPGFDGQRGTGGAAAGIAGGLLAKLSAGPTAAKIATATVAVSTVGAVGTVESDRPVGETRSQTSVVGESPSTVSAPVSPRGREAQANDVSGASVDDRDGAGEAEGTSTSQHDDEDAEAAPQHVAPGGESDSRSEANAHDTTADARGDAAGTGGGHPPGDDGASESPSTSSAPLEPSTSPSAVTSSGTSGSEAEGTGSGSDGSGSSSGPSGSSGSDTSGSGGPQDGGSSGSGSSGFGSGEEGREGP